METVRQVNGLLFGVISVNISSTEPFPDTELGLDSVRWARMDWNKICED